MAEECRPRVGADAETVVVDHFAAAACVLKVPLPRVARGTTVLFAPFAADDAVTAACSQVLSDAERQRSERLATPEVQRSFLQRRAFRRYAAAIATQQGDLARHTFAVRAKGQPWLPTAEGISWSVSSGRSGMLVAWSEVAEIGVDIEDRGRQADCLALSQRYYADAEREAVAEAAEASRMGVFLRYWCLKEAVLKAIGEGIAYGLDRFAFELTPTVRVVEAPEAWGGAEAFQAAELSGPPLEVAAAQAAVVVRLPVRRSASS